MRPRKLTLLILLAAWAWLPALSGCHPGGDTAAKPQQTGAPATADQAAGQEAAPVPLARKALPAAAPAMLGAPPPQPPAPEPADREVYENLEANPVKQTAQDPVSTFSIDVDTGSYSNVRRFLNQGQLPPPDAVRVEELINYFGYAYPPPDKPEPPFRVDVEAGPCPWNPHTQLLRIGLKGHSIPAEKRPPANLVFLLDVSGSMKAENKLPLLQKAFGLLTRQLTAQDRVSMVVYAGQAGLVLSPTPGDQTATILAALDGLWAGGSTAGGEGIQLAYAVARQSFIKGGVNRIILATDGDFNVGRVRFEDLVGMVERERQSGVGLSTLGFGMGNLNERLAEQLADAGNGSYAYIDTLAEANKVLVEGLTANLFTIAQDVKIQIEFNPAQVAEYRLIGYENRLLKREDFANDKVDAGEIGSGHSVTALYEIARPGSAGLRLKPLRYQKPPEVKGAKARELAFLRLRYQPPGGGQSKLLEIPLGPDIVQADLARTSDDFRFAAAVAAFGQDLKGGKYTGQFGYDQIRQLAAGARGPDPHGYRGGFLQLVDLAQSLDHR